MTNQAAWTTAASAADNDVHLGTWINWSRGRVMGATLTLNRVEGNLLIAFSAVFVGIVTERFWRIACIVFYRCRSSPKDSDGLHYQQQAILRNSSSTISAIWTFTQLIWAWHNVAERCFLRVLPTLFTAVFCFCAFTVAGGFSSSLSSGISNEVLLNGTNCGIIDYTSYDPESLSALSSSYAEATHSAANYAQQCYSPDSLGTSDSTGMFDCKHFVKNHLFSTVDNQASCPFRESICRSNNSNIQLDTGYLSLANDLGSNAPPDQDILFRAVLHCAPLKTRGYQSAIHSPTDDFIAYNYGPFSNARNYTYMVESLNSQYNKQPRNPFRGVGNVFILHAGYAPVLKREAYADANGGLRAIPDLFTPDADNIVVFLSGNGIEFFEKTNDPWYHATVPGSQVSVIMNPDEEYTTVYQPDEAASPMGCTEQYQYCNPSLSNNKCGPLASRYDAMIEAAPLFGMSASEFETTSLPNGTMISRYQWFLMMVGSATASTRTAVNTLGPDSLVSPKYLVNGFMGPLPDDQWQTDVQNWWAIFLSSLQAGIVATSRGPVDPALDPYKWLPHNSHIRAMCNNQKIRSTRHVSFSLFGLYFTFVTGLLIIITSFVMEPIFKCLYNRRKYQEYTYLEWSASETLQLQRIGFQSNNDGTWSGCTDSIPRTEPGEILKSLAKRNSPNRADDCESDNTSNRTNVNTVDASSTANGNQDADMVSLDDLMDVSTFSGIDAAVFHADQNLEQSDHISPASR